MSESKNKPTPKKSEAKPKKEAPKKEEPKRESPKNATPQTLGELKKKFAADRKASPENLEALRAEYLKNQVILKAALQK